MKTKAKLNSAALQSQGIMIYRAQLSFLHYVSLGVIQHMSQSDDQSNAGPPVFSFQEN